MATYANVVSGIPALAEARLNPDAAVFIPAGAEVRQGLDVTAAVFVPAQEEVRMPTVLSAETPLEFVDVPENVITRSSLAGVSVLTPAGHVACDFVEASIEMKKAHDDMLIAVETLVDRVTEVAPELEGRIGSMFQKKFPVSGKGKRRHRRSGDKRYFAFKPKVSSDDVIDVPSAITVPSVTVVPKPKEPLHAALCARLELVFLQRRMLPLTVKSIRDVRLSLHHSRKALEHMQLRCGSTFKGLDTSDVALNLALLTRFNEIFGGGYATISVTDYCVANGMPIPEYDFAEEAIRIAKCFTLQGLNVADIAGRSLDFLKMLATSLVDGLGSIGETVASPLVKLFGAAKQGFKNLTSLSDLVQAFDDMAPYLLLLLIALAAFMFSALSWVVIKQVFRTLLGLFSAIVPSFEKFQSIFSDVSSDEGSDESDDSSSEFCLQSAPGLVGVVGMLLAAYYGATVDGSYGLRLQKFLSLNHSIQNVTSGLAASMKMALGLLPMWIQECVYDFDGDFASHYSKSFVEEIELAQYLIDIHLQMGPRAFRDKNFVSRVRIVSQRFNYMWLTESQRCKVPSMNLIVGKIDAAIKLLARDCPNASSMGRRVKPVGVFLWGMPGIGKTRVCDVIESKMDYHKVGDVSYTRGVSKFWDGFHGEELIQYNDPDCVNVQPGLDNPVVELVDLLDTGIFHCNMARVEDKGLCATPKVVTVTSNHDLAAIARSNYKDSDALFRRFQIDLTVMPDSHYGYYDNDKRQFVFNRVFRELSPDAKFMCPHLRFRMARVPAVLDQTERFRGVNFEDFGTPILMDLIDYFMMRHALDYSEVKDAALNVDPFTAVTDDFQDAQEDLDDVVARADLSRQRTIDELVARPKITYAKKACPKKSGPEIARSGYLSRKRLQADRGGPWLTPFYSREPSTSDSELSSTACEENFGSKCSDDTSAGISDIFAAEDPEIIIPQKPMSARERIVAGAKRTFKRICDASKKYSTWKNLICIVGAVSAFFLLIARSVDFVQTVLLQSKPNRHPKANRGVRGKGATRLTRKSGELPVEETDIAKFHINGKYQHALALRPSVYLVNYHLLANNTPNGFHKDGTTCHLETGGVLHQFRFKSDNVHLLHDEAGEPLDFCLLEIPNVPSPKSMLKYFVEEEDLGETNLFDVGYVVTTRGTELVEDLSIVDVPYKYSVLGDIHSSEREVRVARSVEFFNYSEDGDCGTPVLIDGRHGQPRILGIHFALDPVSVTSFDYIFTRAFLTAALDKLPQHFDMDISDIPFVEASEEDMEIDFVDGLEFVGKLDDKFCSAGSRNTKLRKTRVFPALEEKGLVTHYPANLASHVLPEMVGKFGKPSFELPYIDEARQYVLDELLMFMPREARVWSETEAIQGVGEFPESGKMVMKTSAGFPFKYRVHDGKKSLFHYDADDRPFAIKDQQLRSKVDKFVRGAHNHSVVYGISECTLKDELRVAAKVDAPREFTMMSVDKTFIFRRYCGAFMAHVMRHHMGLPIKVGLNVFSKEWDDMMQDLMTNSSLGMAFDYSKFDSKIHHEMLMAVSWIIDSWYKVNDPDYSEEHRLVREALFYEISNSLLSVQGIVYMKYGGMPSGSPVTAIGNSLVNWMYVYIAFQMLRPAGRPFLFSENVRFACYGDDALVSVKPRVAHFYNAATFQGFMARYNIKVTDPEKNPICLPELVPLMQLSFLKCTTTTAEIGIPQRFVPVVEDGSCLKSLAYGKDRRVLDEQFLMNCNDVLRRVFLSGSARFHEMRDFMVDLIRPYPTLRRVARLHGYGELYDIYLKNRGFSDVFDSMHDYEYSSVGLKSGFSLQSGVAPIGGAGNAFDTTHSEDRPGAALGTQLTSNVETKEVLRGPIPDARRLGSILGSLDWDLTDMVSRAQLVDTLEWRTTDGDGHVFRQYINPWDFLNNASSMIRAPFLRFTYSRFDVELTFKANGTRFHQGLLIAYHVPLTKGVELDFHTSSKVSQTALSHVFLDPSCKDEVKLIIPFVHMKEALNTRDHDDEDFLGTVIVQVFNVLKTATSNSLTVPVSVYVKIINAKFRVPAPDAFTLQMGLFDLTGKKTKVTQNTSVTNNYNIENVVAQTLDVGGADEFDFSSGDTVNTEVSPSVNASANVPVVVGEAGQVEASEASASQSTTRRNPLDKPLIGLTPDHFYQKSWSYMTHSCNVDYGNTLDLYPNVPHPADMSHFGTPVDEMQMEYLTQMLTYSRTDTWSNSDPVSTVISSGFLMPCEAFLGAEAGTDIEVLSLDYASARFRFWRGSLKYQFQIVCSNIHQGLLAFCVHYGRSSVPSGNAEATGQYVHYFDVGETLKTFTVEVPYRSQTERLLIYNGETTQADRFSMGSWSLRVVNPLVTMDSIFGSVDVNVFAAGGRDYKLSYFTSHNITLSPSLVPGPIASASRRQDAHTRHRKLVNFRLQSSDGGTAETVLDAQVTGAVEPVIQETQTSAIGRSSEFMPSVRDVCKRFILLAKVVTHGHSIAADEVLRSFSLTPSTQGYFSRLYRVWRGNLRYKILIRSSSEDFAGVVTYLPSAVENALVGVPMTGRSTFAMDWFNNLGRISEVEVPFETRFSVLKIPKSTTDTEEINNLGTLMIGSEGFGAPFQIYIMGALADETRFGMIYGIPRLHVNPISYFSDNYSQGGIVIVPENIVFNFDDAEATYTDFLLNHELVTDEMRAEIVTNGDNCGVTNGTLWTFDSTDFSNAELFQLGYDVYNNRRITEGGATRTINIPVDIYPEYPIYAVFNGNIPVTPRRGMYTDQVTLSEPFASSLNSTTRVNFQAITQLPFNREAAPGIYSGIFQPDFTALSRESFRIPNRFRISNSVAAYAVPGGTGSGQYPVRQVGTVHVDDPINATRGILEPTFGTTGVQLIFFSTDDYARLTRQHDAIGPLNRASDALVQILRDELDDVIDMRQTYMA